MAAGLDHRVPEFFDIIQEVLAAGIAQHLAQQAAQQPDVVPHRARHLMPVKVPADGTGATWAGFCWPSIYWSGFCWPGFGWHCAHAASVAKGHGPPSLPLAHDQ
jgi:hypothetical protein